MDAYKDMLICLMLYLVVAGMLSFVLYVVVSS